MRIAAVVVAGVAAAAVAWASLNSRVCALESRDTMEINALQRIEDGARRTDRRVERLYCLQFPTATDCLP